MIHPFLMFLAPDDAATQGLTQATLRTPPAYPSQVTAPGPVAAPLQLKSVKFAASVLGNAVGFALFIAGCWLCLQLLQAYL
jgi:hypothetical protein